MTRKVIWIAILFICYLFIVGGAVNAGFSRFAMAVPFMVIALLVSIFSLRSAKIAAVTIFFSGLAIFTSLTIAKNPIIFPILDNGKIIILQDGYYERFSDGSGGFLSTEEKEWVDSGTTVFDDVSYMPVKAGEEFKVKAVSFSAPDFNSQVNIVTEVGQLSEYTWNNVSDRYGKVIETNKSVYVWWAEKLSFLMYWPILLLANFPIGLIVISVIFALFLVLMKHLPKK